MYLSVGCNLPTDNHETTLVITGVPISMSTDDIKEHVKGGRVIEAKMFISRKEGQRSGSLSVMLRFEKVLLGKVHIGFLTFNVREFVPYALQCFKYQRMGHSFSV